MDLCFSLSTMKELVEVAAFGSATLFFLWKATSGFLHVNLDLDVDHVRNSLPDSATDSLVTVVILKKGSNATLRLEEVLVFVTPTKQEYEKQAFSFDVSVDTESKRRNLQLPPGDGTKFAHLFEVPRDAICKIEVIVRGKTLFRFPFRSLGVWIASDWTTPPTAT
jgi:hypothetical protein